LASFQVDEALADLEAARGGGPYSHETMIKLHEQLGIAYAYRDDEARAMKEFQTLLALDPGHLMSYTLSPRVTFLFERVRKDPARPRSSSIDLSWPRELSVARPVPIDIEVVADPAAVLSRAAIEVRRKGEPDYQLVDLELAPPGKYRRVELPALGSSRPEVLELHVRAFDVRGNEVLRWGSADEPRELPLGYSPPAPWYRRWWVWAIAGATVAVGTGVTVYALGAEPSDLVDADFDIDR
jgi:hypothetical protein